MSPRRLLARLRGSPACGSYRRPYTRPAMDPQQRALQLKISRRARRPWPQSPEKRLDPVTGKWSRPPLDTPLLAAA